MDLKRFFTDIVDENESLAVLEGEEFFHAVKVTRHKVGYKLIINNNTEYDYYCTVSEINKDRLLARIDEKKKNETETSIPVTLYIGANKDLDTVVQKAVEMGVKRIVPFTSQHSNVDKINVARLNKIILESSKQCGRATLAAIDEITSIENALSVAKDTDIFFFYEFERNGKVADCKLSHKEISVFIGPEGGYSAEERDMFCRSGANVLTLGKRILRVSTAVVAALSLTLEKIGEI